MRIPCTYISHESIRKEREIDSVARVLECLLIENSSGNKWSRQNMHASRTQFSSVLFAIFQLTNFARNLRSENKMNRLHVIDGRVFFPFFLVNNWTAYFGFNEIKIHRNIDVDETRVILQKVKSLNETYDENLVSCLNIRSYSRFIIVHYYMNIYIYIQ